MIWKKVLVAVLAIASLPLPIVFGSIAADLAYKRLLFQGYNVGDLMPGDGAGVSFLTWMCWGVFLLLDLAFWTRVYRRISR